jgi:hypothetical protein
MMKEEDLYAPVPKVILLIENKSDASEHCITPSKNVGSS